MKTSTNLKRNNSSHGYRGKALERSLNKLCKVVQSHGFHAHKNQPERTYSGRFISGEPFDYEIFTDRFKWCFDAKECHKKSWPVANAKLTQINALKQCKNAGIEAFFLVYFYPTSQLVKFDVDLLIETNKKSLTPEEGIEVDLNEIFSGGNQTG